MKYKNKKKSSIIRLENPYLNFLCYLNLFTMIFTWPFAGETLTSLFHVESRSISYAWVFFCGSTFYIEIAIFKIYEIIKKRKLDDNKGNKAYFLYTQIVVFIMNLLLFLFFIVYFISIDVTIVRKVEVLFCLFILWANWSIAGCLAFVTVERLMRAERHEITDR